MKMDAKKQVLLEAYISDFAFKYTRKHTSVHRNTPAQSPTVQMLTQGHTQKSAAQLSWYSG